MTDIDPKALEHACQCAGRAVHHFDRMALDLPLRASIVAHARAIEQHEAFQQEVSDAVEDIIDELRPTKAALMSRFILPKPVDPFVALVGEAVWNDPNEPEAVHCAACILAGLKARGLEVRKIEESE